MTQALLPTPRLDIVPALRDHCDRCGAAGKLFVVLREGGELVFCGHHANAHSAVIRQLGEQIAITEDFEWRGSERTAG